MKRIALIAAAATISGLAALTATGASAGEDACEGQKWPNLSEDCINQIVAEICKAGGGGDTCGESAASAKTGSKRFASPSVSKRQYDSYMSVRTR
jgi:hypothetical protein